MKRSLPTLCLCLGTLLTACRSPLDYRREADQEVYMMVENRRDELFGVDGGFSIDPPEGSLRSRVLAGEVTDLPNLDLVSCLDIAAENNREYQTRKEALYLAALDLTLERWRLGWIASAGGGAGIAGIGSSATTQSVGADGGLSKVLGTGAEIVGGLGLALVNDLSSGDGWQLSSSLSFLFTQPLMAGSGELITYENLTQAERDLVYEVRAFERYRRQLSVDIVEQLLRLGEDVKRIKNERSNYKNVTAIRERNQALSAAGRQSVIQVGQARQDELSSQDRLIDTIQVYDTRLDAFKLLLGLPLELEVSIDQGILARLVDETLPEGEIDPQEALAVALVFRTDFLTVLDRVVDAERQSRVAADALRMGLDLTSAIQVSSDPDRPLRYNFNDVSWNVGLLIDLPVSRLPQRNSYRAALIRLQASARSAEQFQDSMENDLRNELRAVVSRSESHAIQTTAVELAEKRVESASLNQQAGRASTRDLLESQSSLVSSRNALTRAEIDLTLARLDLALDMGLLRVDENGIRIEQVSMLDIQQISE